MNIPPPRVVASDATNRVVLVYYEDDPNIPPGIILEVLRRNAMDEQYWHLLGRCDFVQDDAHKHLPVIACRLLANELLRVTA